MPLHSKRFSGNARLQQAAGNNPPLRNGSSGDAVAIIQQALVDLGYEMPISTARGATDGIYGTETTQVVSEFQSDEELSRDGIAGHDTIGRLDELVAEMEKADEFIDTPPDMRNFAVATARRSRD